jgi:hypothetical protein
VARIHIGPGIDQSYLGLVQILAAISYGMHEAAVVRLGNIFGPAAMFCPHNIFREIPVVVRLV